ncbi:MAG: efflux transporter outer membrane subunit [Desulfovibrionales bacterium]
MITVVGPKFRFIKMILLVAAVTFSPSCTPFAPGPRELSPLDLPQRFTLYTEDEAGPGQWWEHFGSSELNSIVDRALAENFDIRSAWARLSQARAEAAKAGASLYPTLNARGETARRRAAVRNSGDSDARITEIDEYTLGLAAGYEVDLWGRLRANRSALRDESLAAREDVEAALMTVTAEVVNTWIELVGVLQERALLVEQIELNENLLELQRSRLENGLATALDVSQQMENLASIRAQLPLLDRRVLLTRNSLTLLTGQADSGSIQVTRQELPEPIPLPGTGIPADLLAARPDVRAAGLRLQTADWRIAAARADRLPALNFTAGASFSSTSLDLLFSNWLTTLTASLTGPVFDAGRRSAEVERTRAVAEQRLAEYAATVARAVKEVEDGLAGEVKQRQYLERLKEQLSAATLAMRQARIRYLNGDSDYLNYLTGIQNVQRLQRQIVAERAELLKFRVGLYRALGGEWNPLPSGDFRQVRTAGRD